MSQEVIEWILWGVSYLMTIGVTWLVARKEKHRPKLRYTLQVAAFLHRSEVGKLLSMTLGDKEVDNFAFSPLRYCSRVAQI